jgi:hypothetical protein
LDGESHPMRGRNPKNISGPNFAELSRPNGRFFCSPFAISIKEEDFMESSETKYTQRDRMILLRPVELGLVVTFYTLLVKMEPLNKKCNRDILGFFKETGCAWDMNWALCAAAMELEDLDDCFKALHARGMQCESVPVDFYVVFARCGTHECGWPSYFETLDDGKIEFYDDEDNKPCARLKGASVREGKSV